MPARSLVTRTVAGVLVAQLLASAGLAAAVHGLALRQGRAQRAASLEAAAVALAPRYESLLTAGDDAALRAAVTADAAAMRSHLWIAPVASPDAVLACSCAAADHPHGASTLVAFPLGRAAPSVAVPEDKSTGLAHGAARLQPPGRPPLLLALSQSLAEIDAPANRLGATLAGWLAAAFLAVGAVALALSLGVSRRVREMARLLAAHAAGNFTGRADGRGVTELDILAAAVNTSGERLGSQLTDLRIQRAQQEAILQSMDAGVLALDLDQRILRVNAAAERMLNINAAAARGKLLQEVLREPELNRFVEDALADPTIQGDDLELHGERPASVRAACGALRDGAGRSVGLLVLLTDVTELRRLETMRSDFAANVSHELRTPITNIKGYAETLLESDLADEAQTRRFLEVIARNAERLGAIVEDMLLLTRLERSGAEPALATSPTRVAAVVEAVLAQHDLDARNKDICLEHNVPPDLHARVNPQLAELALSNIVGNAIKYSPARTRVLVAARPVDDPDLGPTIELSVADEGPGIAREHLGRIFERFYRVDKARSREQGGTGLGLAIVKHIALVHGGKVEADSAPGRGSTFRLRFPAA